MRVNDRQALTPRVSLVSFYASIALLLCAIIAGCGGGGSSGGVVRDVMPSGDAELAPAKDSLQELEEGWTGEELEMQDGVLILTDRFIVTTGDAVTVTGTVSARAAAATVADLAAASGYTSDQFKQIASPIPDKKTYLVSIPEGADVSKEIKKFEKISGVSESIPNALIIQPETTWESLDGSSSSGSRSASKVTDWAISKINLPPYDDNIRIMENKVRVAVLDSGLDPTHPALSGIVAPGMESFDYSDLGWHGTFVSGIIAAAGKNGAETNIMRGVAEGRIELVPIVVCNSKNQCPYSMIVSGLNTAVKMNAKVINMSMCWDSNAYPGISNLLETVSEKALIVASACNKGEDASNVMPASADYAIGVGATNRDDARCTEADWGTGLASNYGSVLDVAAPGDDIISTFNTKNTVAPGISYALSDGTSFAAPFVSGLAALIFSMNPDFTVDQVRSIIEETSVSISPDKYIGKGRINASAAFDRAHEEARRGDEMELLCGSPELEVGSSTTCSAAVTDQFGDDMSDAAECTVQNGYGAISDDMVFSAQSAGYEVVSCTAGDAADTFNITISPLPSCSSDTECDDHDSYTADVCNKPGTSLAYCLNLPISCVSDADCDDSTPATTDVCYNPGTTAASCVNTADTVNTCTDYCSANSAYNAYFPLGVGYTWNFSDSDDPNHNIVATMKVVGCKTIDDKAYYEIEGCYTPAGYGPAGGTCYIRVSEEDTELVYGYVNPASAFSTCEGNEMLYMDSGAGACTKVFEESGCPASLSCQQTGGAICDVGKPTGPWTCSFPSLSDPLAVDSPYGSFSDCKVYEIGPATTDVGYWVWLCKDVGPTKVIYNNIGGAGAVIDYELQSATLATSEPACYSDADCDDGNPDSYNFCNSPGTCNAYCSSSSCTPACTTAADCPGDNDPDTYDVCLWAGNCAAKCSSVGGGMRMSMGDYFSCTVVGNKTLKCWGGISYSPDPKVAVEVATFGDTILDIDTSGSATCIAKADGTMRCWESARMTDLPTTISGVVEPLEVAMGDDFRCTMLVDGRVKCWGGNSYGQLGNGTTTNAASPVTVSGISNAVSMDAGPGSACAALLTGAVKCWGRNIYGQLGNGSTVSSSTPVYVYGVTEAVKVAVAGEFACALMRDKTVKCWGRNHYGQLGNGSTRNSSVPVEVYGITNASDINNISGTDNILTCAVLEDGTLSCWGHSTYSLGDEYTYTSSLPLSVPGITNAETVGTGVSTICMRLSNGGGKCWGLGRSGQLGNDSYNSSETPVDVIGLP